MYTDDTYWYEVGGGASRFLNALTKGDSSVTFSAWSWFLAHDVGSKWGKIRVWAIDLFAGKDHCKIHHEWHMARNLYSAKALQVMDPRAA